MPPDRRELNLLAGTHIPSKLLRKEPLLWTKKWFDYRYMNVTEATQLFAREYSAAYRFVYAENFDVHEAQLKRGVANDDLFACDARTITSLWQARQAADDLGVPYDFFAFHALRHLMDQGYQNIPRPNQTYSPAALEAVQGEWERERNEIKLRISLDPRYRSDHYRADPAQIAHHEWIVEYIKRRISGHVLLLKLNELCFVNQVLTESVAVAEFGEQVVADARNRPPVVSPRPPLVADVTDFRPSCFGTPHSFEASPPVCGACGHHRECADQTSVVVAEIQRVHGAIDPKDAQQRDLAAARQRRRREKLKAKPPAALCEVSASKEGNKK